MYSYTEALNPLRKSIASELYTILQLETVIIYRISWNAQSFVVYNPFKIFNSTKVNQTFFIQFLNLIIYNIKKLSHIDFESMALGSRETRIKKISAFHFQLTTFATVTGILQMFKNHATFAYDARSVHARVPSIRPSRNFIRYSATAMTCERIKWSAGDDGGLIKRTCRLRYAEKRQQRWAPVITYSRNNVCKRRT